MKFKDNESQQNHLERLIIAIACGGNFSIPKTYWCEEHKCYEY